MYRQVCREERNSESRKNSKRERERERERKIYGRTEFKRV